VLYNREITEQINRACADVGQTEDAFVSAAEFVSSSEPNANCPAFFLSALTPYLFAHYDSSTIHAQGNGSSVEV
jgi:hypothetical protein